MPEENENREGELEEETVAEETEEAEEETEESQEDSEEETTEDAEDSEEEDIDWKERALKAEKLIQKNKKKAKETKKEPVSSDDATLARLESRGVIEAEDQTYVLRFAKAEGVHPVEALSDQVVQDRLAHNQKQREQRAATQAPSSRTGRSSNEVDRWVRRYKKDGSLPDNPRIVSQVLDKLKEN